ncbi:hypothetical protein [Bacillus sp. EAC]|uniref:hypothetical protein n=1 Tax=Bacillus sp. EAC TaxID=1978338 RepID=UPI000B42E66C|nr:hypothetical protein [Bacillus sp. EAC]
MTKKKDQVLYFILGAFLFGIMLYMFHSFIWSFFFLLFISYLITLKLADDSRSFRRQMLSASIGIFFFGLISVLIILIAKGFIMYVIDLYN